MALVSHGNPRSRCRVVNLIVGSSLAQCRPWACVKDGGRVDTGHEVGLPSVWTVECERSLYAAGARPVSSVAVARRALSRGGGL